MKTLLRIAALTFGTNAAACSLCGSGGWGFSAPSGELRLVVSGMVLANSALTTALATYALTDPNLSMKWFIAPSVLAVVNVAFAVITGATASNDPNATPLIVGHAVAAVAGAAVGIAGLNWKSRVTPTVAVGRDGFSAGVAIALP